MWDASEAISGRRRLVVSFTVQMETDISCTIRRPQVVFTVAYFSCASLLSRAASRTAKTTPFETVPSELAPEARDKSWTSISLLVSLRAGGGTKHSSCRRTPKTRKDHQHDLSSDSLSQFFREGVSNTAFRPRQKDMPCFDRLCAQSGAREAPQAFSGFDALSPTR